MSSLRGPSRKPNRQHQQSPYARTKPKAPVKKSWSITSFLSYFNPLRSSATEEEEEEEDTEGGPIIVDVEDQPSPAEALANRGIQLANGLFRQEPNGTGKTPAKSTLQRDERSTSSPESPPLKFPSFQQSQSPSRDSLSSSARNNNIATVTAYLNERRGQTFTEMEIEGMVSLLQKSTKLEDKPEPFRFSVSPLTSGRGNTPSQPDANVARKVLKKNPNGTLRWQGGGSSRPRNRYRSPAFGPSTGPPKMKLSTPPEPAKTEHKRRRVTESSDPPNSNVAPPSEDSAASASRRTGSDTTLPFPLSNTATAPPPAINNSAPPPKTNEASTSNPPRLRPLLVPAKPTQPAIPSPLRQAWGQNDSPPQPKQQTKAASFMADLIKEVTPPKKPDLTNPYQASCPVPVVRPNKKPVTRRTRASEKKAAEEKEKEKEKEREREKAPLLELTPQEIIEATVPKGSKRSRPPGSFDKPQAEDVGLQPPPSPSLRRSPRQLPFEIPSSSIPNGVPHINGNVNQLKSHFEGTTHLEENDRAKKRQKTPPLSFSEPEVQDVDMAPEPPTKPAERQATTLKVPPAQRGPSVSPPNPNKPLPNVQLNAPKEPSKLRFSYQPESNTPTPGSSTVGTPQPQPPLTLNKTETKKVDPKESALTMAVDALPKFSFVMPANVAGPSNPKAQQSAKSVPSSSLPTFDFSRSTWKEKAPEKSTVVAPAVAAPTGGGFNWAAAGMKAPEKPSGGSWTCSLCDCKNPASATEKCTVCDTPKPGGGKGEVEMKDVAAPPAVPAPAPSTGGFNWAAAGMKPPEKPAGGKWNCGVCGLSNPADAKDKCSVCDSPRP